MATSKQLEANQRSGRARSKRRRAEEANRPTSKEANRKHKASKRQQRRERVERDARMKAFWVQRRMRWEAEMRAITSKALPNFNPMEDPGSVYRALRGTRR